MDNKAAPIPADFPKGDFASAVSGMQPKLVGRMIDGQFVTGWTEQERHAHFEVCADLVDQLVVYCRRKLAEDAGMDIATLLPKVRRAVQGKGWGLSDPELDWIIRSVSKRIEDPADN